MRRLLHHALPIALLGGCAPGTPDHPTWVADVQPILAANCVRCHGGGALGGAPTSFRLDTLEDAFVDGQVVRGARSMAEFIAARAASRGDMPPRGPRLSGRQKDILDAWQVATEVGARATNHPPTAVLDPVAGTADAQLTLTLTVDDADGDLVTGELRFTAPTGPMVIAPLQNGRREVVWDTRVVAPGSYAVSAALDDGAGPVVEELTTVQVAHASGNTAPQLTFLTTLGSVLFVGAPTEIVFATRDPDPDAELTVTIDAEDGVHTVPLTVSAAAGTATLDPAALPEGPSWRLVAHVSDGVATTDVRSPQFLVSHATTSETYESVKPILDAVCVPCHPGHVTPADFGTYDDILALRGRAWRKVVQQREMPPRSRTVVTGSPDLTEEQRRRLGEWLFAGAPP